MAILKKVLGSWKVRIFKNLDFQSRDFEKLGFPKTRIFDFLFIPVGIYEVRFWKIGILKVKILKNRDFQKSGFWKIGISEIRDFQKTE